MPIYEYYCPGCHTLLNFFSRSVRPASKPVCPHCGKKGLERQISMFSAVYPAKTGDGGEGDSLPVDEQRMERAMESLAAEAEHLNPDDPRTAAQLMRRFSKMAGMEFKGDIEQALRRMEAGEDPEQIEAELGDALDDDDPFVPDSGTSPGRGGARGRRGAPKRDDTLYEF